MQQPVELFSVRAAGNAIHEQCDFCGIEIIHVLLIATYYEQETEILKSFNFKFSLNFLLKWSLKWILRIILLTSSFILFNLFPSNQFIRVQSSLRRQEREALCTVSAPNKAGPSAVLLGRVHQEVCSKKNAPLLVGFEAL